MSEDFGKLSIEFHKNLKGKIGVFSKVNIKTAKDLSVFYTPGIAAVSQAIHKKNCLSFEYTIRKNSVAVISDGSAVLGLGNIGPLAAHPVMAGKALLFKQFADIDAFPICLDSQNTDELILIIKALAPSFGAINLEDISAPRCFEIEEKLQDVGIPVMHDDQHGTAVVVLAGLINALKVVGKKIENTTIVVNGLGAAGTATARMISDYANGKCQMRLIDIDGLVCSRTNLNKYQKQICQDVNAVKTTGNLQKAIIGADVFIGLSAPNILSSQMIKKMAKNPIVFAMANPTPEIDPLVAKKAGAAIVATGRSDFPNQVNNVLAFPAIFRGALDAAATKITKNMKIAAANELSLTIKNPSAENILPSPLDKSVVKKISKAVAKAAIKDGVTRPSCSS
ncbi:MAG: NAD-dependent malic enzyme [candidate division WS2 bacterium ADurb.Bin280]|uniref:NAD-dependent malic enzyme n=1 Tax=candidate division WS2 bacterium ADurb.Bin280 TaxID=1852829 RepID=A0A1V5SGL7_9BACT|nr:MAG: NAD-dependent malic enzyme [candidate division WS2 bacterium ADurb.Bin280]